MHRNCAMIPILLAGFLTTLDHTKISYRHYKCGHDKVIIIAHGFYNSKDAVLLKQLADSLLGEYDVFAFDFRGHGQSSGLYTWTSRENRDLEAVLDYISGKYKKTGIIAFSFGASTAINTLARGRKVDSLVCISAAEAAGKTNYHFWELDLKGDLAYTLFTHDGMQGRGCRPGPFWLKKERAIDNVGKLRMPILFIHGARDWVIKPRHSQALFEKTQSRKRLVIIGHGPHAEYLLRDQHDKCMQEIRAWFKDTL